MTELKILLEGDPRLRQKATKIRAVDDGLRALARDMHETIGVANGIGLAGPQIGVMRRIIAVHLPEGYQGEGEPEISMTLVNPEIVKSHGREVGVEGCLSIPGWIGDVPRAERVTVKALDLNNREVRIKAEGTLARVLQHEVDHLDGILYLDRVEDKSTIRHVADEDEYDDDDDVSAAD
jgi:peptide deformylase